jgi:hypothetical protein
MFGGEHKQTDIAQSAIFTTGSMRASRFYPAILFSFLIMYGDYSFDLSSKIRIISSYIFSPFTQIEYLAKDNFNTFNSYFSSQKKLSEEITFLRNQIRDLKNQNLTLQNTKNSLTNKLNSTIDSILRYRAFYVGSYYYFPKTRAVKFSSDPDLNQYVKSYMLKYFGYNLSDNDIKNYMGQFYINKGLSAFKDSKTQILKANDTLEKIIKLY